MTDLRERLDELADSATIGVSIDDPSVSAKPSNAGGQRRMLVLGAAVAAAVLLVLGLVLVDDGTPDVVASGGVDDLTPAILTDATAFVDSVPGYYRELHDFDELDLDLGAVRAGPSVDGVRLYVAPTSDGVGFCMLLVPDAERNFESLGASTSCGTVAGVLTTGLIGIAGSSPGGRFTAGVVTADVIDVDIEGATVVFEDGAFIASGVDDLDAVELVRSPERTRLVTACDALGPLVQVGEGRDMSESEAAALMATADGAEVEEFGVLAALLEPVVPAGVDFDEMGSEAALGAATFDAAAVCEREEVPGWAIAYQPPHRSDRSTPQVDLSLYGEVQRLSDTPATSDLIRGPGLGPVTRVQVTGTDVEVFWWLHARPNTLFCVHADLDRISRAGCDPAPLAHRAWEMSDLSDTPSDGSTVHIWRVDDDASFVTATARDTTHVQAVRGEYAVFVLPSGPAELAEYESSGDRIGLRQSGAGFDPVPAGVVAHWVNQTGMQAGSDDVWPERMARACDLGVWQPEIAQALAIEFIDADGANETFFDQGGDEIDLQEEAAAALWVMAIQVCRDAFPPEKIAEGPFFDFRDR